MIVSAHPAARGSRTEPTLKQILRRAERDRQLKLLVLALPLVLFLLIGFAVPIAAMIFRSVDNSLLPSLLPRTSNALAGWDDEGLPDDTAFAAFADDLIAARSARNVALIGKHLNYEIPGFRSLIGATANSLVSGVEMPVRQRFATIDARWLDPAYWTALKRATRSYSLTSLLAAIDLKIMPSGTIERLPPELSIHLTILLRTFWISAIVCTLCLLLGLPVALLLASVSARVRNLLLILVLLPFWTSLLVRTTAWIVLLQNAGVVNKFLLWLGVIEEPLPLMFNRFGVIIAMTHVLLPFMILPLYSAMTMIPLNYIRASLSLGASPTTTFFRIYLPLVSPGVRSGCLLVFILALGYYITPALVGGPSDQMLSYVIAFHANTSLNWSLAASLSLVLLGCVFGLYVVSTKLLGPVNLKFVGRM